MRTGRAIIACASAVGFLGFCSCASDAPLDSPAEDESELLGRSRSSGWTWSTSLPWTIPRPGGTSTDTSGQGGSASGGASSAPTIPSAENSCLSGITDYGNNGPFKYSTRTSGSVKMWIPAVPSGCRVPMVHLANGTGAMCSTYSASLTRLASHGFLALCFESTNTGAGDQGITAFETALRLYPDLADYRFGSTGHSQGGQASFIVLQYAEQKWGSQGVYAGLAMQPASGFGAQPTTGSWQKVYAKIASPMFMFSGAGTDGLVSQSWVQSAFDALSDSVEAYFWTKQGSTHIPVPNGEEQEISIPWFRWKLLGDQKACEYFKAIPKAGSGWSQVAKQNETACK